MSDFEETPSGAEIRRLMEEGFIDSMVSILRSKFPGMAEEVEDAVANAVLKVVTRTTSGKPIEDLRGYLFTAARNGVMDAYKRRDRLDEYDPDQHARSGLAPDEEVLQKEMFRVLQRLVRAWPNRNIREYTLLYLDSLLYDEPLTLQDAAAQLGDVLGEPVNVKSIGTWKRRGIAQLVKDYTAHRLGDHEPGDERND